MPPLTRSQQRILDSCPQQEPRRHARLRTFPPAVHPAGGTSDAEVHGEIYPQLPRGGTNPTVSVPYCSIPYFHLLQDQSVLQAIVIDPQLWTYPDRFTDPGTMRSERFLPASYRLPICDPTLAIDDHALPSSSTGP